MKYSVGQKVRIKSIDWYNENKNEFGDVKCSLNCSLTKSMSIHCGSIQTIESVVDGGMYWMKENPFNWADEMIEGLAGEEMIDLTSVVMEIVEEKSIQNALSYGYNLPEGYIFKDENGNIINATKIVLEKKKKEYPNTYDECAVIMGVGLWNCLWGEDATEYEEQTEDLMDAFIKLKICRDAYWKIAGEEMGLGKPWKPYWEDENQEKYIIGSWLGTIQGLEENFVSHPFAFPTEEMRDAFKGNFDKDLELCKELL